MDLTFNVAKERLQGLLQSTPGLELALLFGSLVDGRLGPRSDIDIALLFNGLSSRDMVREVARLNGEISLLLNYDEIDTVLLNGLDNPVLKTQVAQTGLALFKEVLFYILFKTQARAEYFDHQVFQKKRALHRRRVKGEGGSP